MCHWLRDITLSSNDVHPSIFINKFYLLLMMCTLDFCVVSGVFPKWAELLVNSTNSGNLINRRSMNCIQFKDPVSHMCLAGTVIIC